MIEVIIARLKDRVPNLRGRVDGALAFDELVRANSLPASTTAYVVPDALRGGQADASAGAYVQEITETISVVLMLRPNDRFGARGIDPIEELRGQIFEALAGWAPGDETGVFQMTRAKLLRFQGGAIVYEIVFSITDQLRILS